MANSKSGVRQCSNNRLANDVCRNGTRNGTATIECCVACNEKCNLKLRCLSIHNSVITTVQDLAFTIRVAFVIVANVNIILKEQTSVSTQWRRNEFESGGTGPAPEKNFFGRALPLFYSKSTISRFSERVCGGQYSLVSFLFAVLLLKGPHVPSYL